MNDYSLMCMFTQQAEIVKRANCYCQGSAERSVIICLRSANRSGHNDLYV